jgi:hypothetical protein
MGRDSNVTFFMRTREGNYPMRDVNKFLKLSTTMSNHSNNKVFITAAI